MAENRVQVDIVAENADLRQKLAQAEAAIASFGATGKKDAGGAATALEEAEQILTNIGKNGAAGAERGISRAASATKAFGTALRYLAFPVIVVTSALKVSQYLLDAQERAKRFREELRGITQEFTSQANADALKVRIGSFELDKTQAQRSAQALEETLKQNIFQRLTTATLVNKLAPGYVSALLGFDDASIKKMVAEASAALKKVQEDLQNELASIAENQRRAFAGEENAARLRLILDEETRIREEWRLREQELERQWNATREETTRAHLEAMRNLESQYVDQRLLMLKNAIDRQNREFIDQQKKLQSEGFTIKDLNTTNIGSGSALQIIGQQLPALVTLAGGGH